MNRPSTHLLYKSIEKRRKDYVYSFQENKFITSIKKNTVKHNLDNISRTKAYAAFYERNKKVKWSFLASMVSRNAGWNMTDLEGRWYTLALSWNQRFPLFYTYELANWMIFQDAFPQLLLYELSSYYNKPLFHLLKEFHVSCFMESEWERFWLEGDEKRLVTSLIINEQNLIQQPVLQNHVLKKKVFKTLVYFLQDLCHFNCVIFPTLEGKLYGYSVHGFQKLSNRIELGKKLAALLFSESYYEKFHEFSIKTEHTGSRYDYEKNFKEGLFRETPILRSVYPVLQHVQKDTEDWVLKRGKPIQKWLATIENEEKQHEDVTKWFIHKQHQLHGLIALKKWI
ncbi:DUF2515 family protein [Sutcliffiella halmapala]|uniref:DUF2515 family protein n=1 Tax=Sutcliffiella halmapala TaxID=79882 RepID=UPI001F47D88C|nr:DUF2515 family protein [Sutcliffiella halmapala]